MISRPMARASSAHEQPQKFIGPNFFIVFLVVYTHLMAQKQKNRIFFSFVDCTQARREVEREEISGKKNVWVLH